VKNDRALLVAGLVGLGVYLYANRATAGVGPPPTSQAPSSTPAAPTPGSGMPIGCNPPAPLLAGQYPAPGCNYFFLGPAGVLPFLPTQYGWSMPAG
jgi:hypothetical protein